LKQHDGPTELFNDFVETHHSPAPFTDVAQLFSSSIELANSCSGHLVSYFSRHKHTALVKAWEQVFLAAIQAEIAETVFDADLCKSLSKIGLQLARTPPSIFGDTCFKEDDNGKGEFHALSFESAESGHSEEILCQRHDITQWIACFNIFGNAWQFMSAESLVDRPDPSRNALKIVSGHDGDITFVSQAAKDAMTTSVEHLANQPTIFFKCKYVIMAVCAILGHDFLQYSLPQSTEELEAFDWLEVVVGEMSTYPPPVEPSNEDYKTVKTVHEAVKAEKDEVARLAGMLKSGVQSYITYKQKWRLWRVIMAVFHAQYPKESLDLIEARARACLKMCKSEAELKIKLHEEVRKHIAKVKRDLKKVAQKEALEKQLEATKTAEAEAAESAKQAAEKAKALAEEQARINSQNFAGTRQQQKNLRKQALDKAKADKAKAEAERQEFLQKQHERKREQEELRKRQLEAEKEDEASEQPKKVSKKNDIARLEDITPRGKFDKMGEAWLPPHKVDRNVMHKPGSKWKAESCRKLALLSVLRTFMRNQGLLTEPMAFNTVMEFIGADSGDHELEFNGKVFIYLVALVLNQKRQVNHALLPALHVAASRILLIPLSLVSVLLMMSLRFC